MTSNANIGRPIHETRGEPPIYNKIAREKIEACLGNFETERRDWFFTRLEDRARYFRYMRGEPVTGFPDVSSKNGTQKKRASERVRYWRGRRDKLNDPRAMLANMPELQQIELEGAAARVIRRNSKATLVPPREAPVPYPPPFADRGEYLRTDYERAARECLQLIREGHAPVAESKRVLAEWVDEAEKAADRDSGNKGRTPDRVLNGFIQALARDYRAVTGAGIWRLVTDDGRPKLMSERDIELPWFDPMKEKHKQTPFLRLTMECLMPLVPASELSQGALAQRILNLVSQRKIPPKPRKKRRK